VLAALPDEERAPLRGLEREQWYLFRTFAHLDEVIARLYAPDDPLIHEHLGEASARHRTEWLGEHAHLYSVHGFLSRAADDHRQFQSFGEAVYRRTGFTEGQIEFSGYPEAYVVFCRASRGYFRRTVEILTGAAVEVDELRCQTRGEGSCLFRIRWQERPARVP
jgi:hypothetical protein